ncbi:MAG TPA: hypothetical protein V6C72_09180, partial [Chroococcales cyanobacterium]
MSLNSPDSLVEPLLDLANEYEKAGDRASAAVLRRQTERSGAAHTPMAGLTRANSPDGTVDHPSNSAAASFKQPSVAARCLLSAGISIYLICLALILSPNSLWRDRLLHPFAPFLGGLGFWQSWNVFAPDIRKDNFHLLAVVSYNDGRQELWEFPRQEKLSGLEKMRAERFRKWANDRVRYVHFPYLLPDAARYIAHLHMPARGSDRERYPAYVDLLLLS